MLEKPTSYGVVVLSKYPAILRRWYESLVLTESPPLPQIVVVADNRPASDFGDGEFKVVTSWGQFIFSRNANIGINHLAPKDVILSNDDVEFVDKDSLRKLAEYSQARPNVGIAAPLVDGGVGNPFQDYNRAAELWKPGKIDGTVTGRKSDSLPVCFICVFLKRKMFDEIGLMDESFVGYGFDDNAMCIQARRSNWKTNVTAVCHVKHGSGGKNLEKGVNWHLTYGQTPGLKSNQEIFLRKFGSQEIS